MYSLNKVCLIGNLGKEPEIRSLQNGNEVAGLSLATSDGWKDKNTGEWRERTEWHRVAVYSSGLIKLIKSKLKKGSKIYVEGELRTRKWTDNNGIERYLTEIIVQGYGSFIRFLDPKDKNQSGADDARTYAAATNGEFVAAELDDEIPF